MDINTYKMIKEMREIDQYEFFLMAIKKAIHQAKDDKERKNFEEVLRNIRFGNKIKFDIEEVWKERYKKVVMIKQRKGREVGDDIPKIIISGNKLDQKLFEDEFIERMRNVALWVSENIKVEVPREMLNMSSVGVPK